MAVDWSVPQPSYEDLHEQNRINLERIRVLTEVASEARALAAAANDLARTAAENLKAATEKL